MESRFAAALAKLGPPWPAAVAVSGGGDSLALMLLLKESASRQSHPLPAVLTVDHGLQPSAAREAGHVRKLARAAGLSAHVLKWKGAKPTADIESEARTARYALMGEWCAEHLLPALYTAHTLEDQAETFLLRLARGSGLDGLAAMQKVSQLPVPELSHIKLVRPLLDISKEELRAFLKSRKIDWVEDPMNTDVRFSRVRMRAAWPQLCELGLTPQRIADAARHLARARLALEEMTDGFLRRGVRFQGGGAALDPVRLKILPREAGLRALASVLSRVSGEAYRPRFESLERLFDFVVSGSLEGGATLHGCIVAPAAAADRVFGSATITILRESPRKVREPGIPPRRRSHSRGAAD